MKKTRLNRLVLTVLLVATITSLATFIFIHKVVANPTVEDFTTYTEVDPNNHVTINNSTQLNFTAWVNEDAYVYKDSEIDSHYVDFSHKVDLLHGTENHGVAELGGFWALTNDINDLKGLETGGKNFLAAYIKENGGAYDLYIQERYGGASHTDFYSGIAISTWYYLLIERSSTTFTCKIYSSDALRAAGGTADIDTLAITLQSAVAYRYAFAGISYNNALPDYVEMHIRNLDFQYDYEYTFYGLFDETTGDPTGAVNVTAHFQAGAEPEIFEVNGNFAYGSYIKPIHFLFNLTNDREYWLSDDEDTATIYIFDDSTTTYTITFFDLAGILVDVPYVEARRYVNATLRTVEKRKVDVEDKIVMNLVNGIFYTLVITDGSSYTYGDLLMTSTTTVSLTLKGIEFPKETLLTYKNVRVYGERAFDNPTGNISITYEDLLLQTNSVYISIDYRNGTNAYNATEVVDSFVHTWTSASNNTDYAVVCTINHTRYGVYDWKQYFPALLDSLDWGLDFLGSLPFDTAYILPSLLIVFAAGCFSVLNAEVGAFLATIVAIILAYAGWLPIPAATLIVAFTLSILMALAYAKRRQLG